MIILTLTPDRPLSYWLQWHISPDYEVITSDKDGLTRVYFYGLFVEVER